jgi:hypothetical protein
MDDREKKLELSEYLKPTCFIQVQPFAINTGLETFSSDSGDG